MISNDQLSSPLELVLEVTNRCNLSCKYCYCDECISNRYKQDISFNTFKKIIDEANDLDIFQVCINGGECFLLKDIFKMFDYMISKNLDFSIVTNGTLLRKKEIHLLDKKGLIPNLQISIDSHNSDIHNIVRGKYEETVDAINLISTLCEDKPNLGSVIHKQNYSTYADTLRLFSTKCSNFHLMNVQTSKKAIENRDLLFVDAYHLAEFWNNIQKVSSDLKVNVDIYENDLKPLETAKFTGCTAGKTKLVVKPNLNVIPCDITRNLILGNLKSQTIEEVWGSNKRKEIGNSRVEPCYEANKQRYLEQPIEVRGN